MTIPSQIAHSDFKATARQLRAAPLWPHWLRRVIASVVHFARARSEARDLRPAPIFRIERLWHDRWIACRRDSLVNRVFPNLERAVAYIVDESGGSPVTVEVRIDDFYVVAPLDPQQPGLLFGETVTECVRDGVPRL